MKLITTFENFVRFSTIFSTQIKYLLLLVLIVPASMTLVSSSQAGESGADAFVGEVTLVLGKAYVERSGKNRRNVEVGSPIRVNDQIVTGANGHVHIRFVDQALVSVRPGSRLEIVRYDYNASQPENSTIKFNLIEGVTRSISGDAAKSARERYRLNTPIAAIGVRGTDFVVSASQQTVRALVNEGIIVMAPFSADCTADSFGPCSTNAVELSGDSLQILELDTQAPTLLLATLDRDPSIMRDETPPVVADNPVSATNEVEEQAASGDIYLENVTSLKVTEVAEAEVEAITRDFTPAEPISAEILLDRQLVWGRWIWSEGQGDLERITVPVTEVSETHQITLANLDYGLFRVEENGIDTVEKGLGIVGFALQSAQAFYHSESGVVAMQVNDGSLSINFINNTFGTELNLNSSATGAIDFSAAGSIFSSGYFYDRSDTQKIFGAISLDGSEAGYFFDQQLENGGIQGLTLWDSR
ncbi:MAG: FecR domain-containing protein [Gammaproteobacteria bacterium]|nr:FecR domain-containing protein [Gammaproteobacteria bacterium]